MKIWKIFLVVYLFTFSIYGEEHKISEEALSNKELDISLENKSSNKEAGTNISSNPAAVKIATGTGAIGKMLGFTEESGIRIGGLWIGDINNLFTGGLDPHKTSGNSLFQLSLEINFEKRFGWKGGLFCIEFLRFDGSPTNVEAGCVQAYNGLTESPPLDRSELYQYWFRQELFAKKLVIRIGKSLPSYDFNNVINPIPFQDSSLAIPATTGLIYTPIFLNPTMLGVLPGYYNSAFGITGNFVPTKSYYISCGAYDGNLARGKQTGIRGPQFNGYYFYITETGFNWEIGKLKMSGKFAIGAWYQSGKLTAVTTAGTDIEQRGTKGIYLFGSQRLWRRHPGVDNSGIIGFVQAGINDSRTLQINNFFGAGLTFLGLVPHRLDDSFGFGMALSKLNHHLFIRKKELLLQGYYQAHLYKSSFLECALSYIPKPGAAPHLKSAWAGTARIIALF
jgi:porin